MLNGSGNPFETTLLVIVVLQIVTENKYLVTITILFGNVLFRVTNYRYPTNLVVLLTWIHCRELPVHLH